MRPAQLHFTVRLVPDTDWETMFRGLVGLAPTDFEQIKTLCAVNRIEFLDPPEMPDRPRGLQPACVPGLVWQRPWQR